MRRAVVVLLLLIANAAIAPQRGERNSASAAHANTLKAAASELLAKWRATYARSRTVRPGDANLGLCVPHNPEEQIL